MTGFKSHEAVLKDPILYRLMWSRRRAAAYVGKLTGGPFPQGGSTILKFHI